MTFKDILAPAVRLEHDAIALKAATVIAQAFDAHATALVVAVHLSSSFSAKTHTLSEILADIAAGSRSAAARERKQIIDWLEHAPIPFEVRDVTIENAVAYSEVLAHTRLADLNVCARPSAKDRAHEPLFERILFGSGRPVLLLPASYKDTFKWKRVLIGWNASTEAIRAVISALPFLQTAEEVTIAVVDALPTRSGHGEAPGWDLAKHLAHHGVRTTVRNIDGLGRTEGGALLDEARDLNADVMVLGAYGRARASEFVFGGVTRALLHDCALPMLLAH